MRRFDFTDSDWVTYLKTYDLPHLNQWMLTQASRGQDYHAARLQRLGLSGERVLDAGCGVGNWALALARFFSRVDAMDSDKERLDILAGMTQHFEGRIVTTLGSTEAIPFADATFDTVYCNGVIFLTNYKKTLAEFARVLKPDGVLFLCYNGIAWWQFLLLERGKSEPDCVLYGSNGLTSLLLRLLDELCFETRVPEGVREDQIGILCREFGSEPESAYSAYIAAPAKDRRYVDERVIAHARTVLAARGVLPREAVKIAKALTCLDDLFGHGLSANRDIICRDLVSRTCHGYTDHALPYETHSHDPEEMTEELMRHGFHHISSASDGCLCLDHTAPSANPFYELRKGVYETLCRASGAAARAFCAGPAKQ